MTFDPISYSEITKIKKSFDSVTNQSVNLFDGNYLEGLALVVGTTPMTLHPEQNGVSVVIPIDSSTTYYFRKFDNSNRTRIALTTSQTPPTAGSLMTTDINRDTKDYAEFTITTGPMDKFLVITLSTVGEKPRIQVTKNDIRDYNPPGIFLDGSKTKNVDMENLTERVTTAITQQKLGIDTWAVGSIDTSGENISSYTRVRTPYIKVREGTVIKTEQQGDTDGFYVFLYDLENYSFMKDSGGYVTEYVIEYDCYIRLVSRYTDLRNIYDPNDFNGKFLLDWRNVHIKKNTPIIFGDFSTLYRSPNLADVSNGNEFDLGASTIVDIYTMYDDLMSENVGISKTLLGYGSDSEGVEDASLPIYEYVLEPPTRNNYTPPVKCLLMTGIHGEEKGAVWSTLQFITQMLKASPEKSNLNSIRANVKFHIIPIANPYGFNTHQRLNARGVDLNRNFSYKWEDETQVNTKGPFPYSELETQLLSAWMQTHSDADFFIDYHNFSSETNFSYLDTPEKSLWNIYSSMMRQLTISWKYTYNELGNLEENTSLGFITNDQRPMTFNEAIHVAGIKFSSIIESPMFWQGVKYTSETIQMGVDVLSNYLLALLNAYDKLTQ